MKKLLILLVSILLLMGCTRTYNVFVMGNENSFDVNPHVEKTTDVAPTLDLDLVP